MLGTREIIARSWRFWGVGLGGVTLLAQVLAVADPAPTREERPDPVPSHSSWRAGRPVGIRVENGQASFQAPAGPRASRLLVIVSSLARGSGPYPVTVRVRPASRPNPPRLDSIGSDPVPLAPLIENLPPIPRPAAGRPPLERTFHLMVRDGDVASSRNYAAIRGRLRAVGKWVQVYVAAEDLDRVGADVLQDLVETFDDHVLPTAAGTFGQSLDVDGDGRFTIFLSSWLARMGQGSQAVDGFVRVADLDRAYSPPFGNRCDMMYLSADLKAGPHLRTVMAHEYTHAVIFSRKALGSGRPDPVTDRVEEEGWLDEALAHLAEDLHGFSRSNLDYRVSAFLSKPESYRLVVDDYYSANLFRSHGNRGSTYLFLRWCADRYGPALLPGLIGSDQCGLANLEATTHASFGDLYRRWSLALAAAALGPGVMDSTLAEDGFQTLDLRRADNNLCLAGPRIDRVDPRDGEATWNATGTSSRFLIVGGVGSDAVDVRVSAPPEADLQVTSLPLPRDLPMVELTTHPSYDAAGDLNLSLSAIGRGRAPIRLIALAWEPLIPPADPRLLKLPRGRLDRREIEAYFGTCSLDSGQSLRSSPIKLEGVRRESGPYVLKLIGRDAAGRTVTAWADVNTNAKPSSRRGEPGDPAAATFGGAAGGEHDRITIQQQTK
jgi:hypothetical protein